MTSTFKALSRVILLLALGIGSLAVAEYNYPAYNNGYNYNVPVGSGAPGYNPGAPGYNPGAPGTPGYNPGVYTPRPGTVGPATPISTPPYVAPMTHGPIAPMGYPMAGGYGGYGGYVSSYSSFTAVRVVRYSSVCFRPCQARCYRPCAVRRPCCARRCGGGFHFSIGFSFGGGCGRPCL